MKVQVVKAVDAPTVLALVRAHYGEDKIPADAKLEPRGGVTVTWAEGTDDPDPDPEPGGLPI